MSSKTVASASAANVNGGPSRAARGVFWFAALAGVLVILLHESLFFGKGLVPADGVLSLPPWNQQIAPSNPLLVDQYAVFIPTEEFVHQQKRFPLWNPYLCCGMPNLGAIQWAWLFPIRLLFSWLDPFAASGPSAFLKLLLAGWFTLLYVRLLGVSHAGSFLAGLTFCLSSFMILWLGHPHVNCAMWLPFLLYFLEKSFRDESVFGAAALRNWCGFAIVFAFMILGGHPPTAVDVCIVVALYFLFRLLGSRRGQILQRVGALAGSVAIALLLAAPQILPYLEYYAQSSAALNSAHLQRWTFHLHPCSLIHYMLPNALGNPSRGYDDITKLLNWPDTNNYNERTGYVGILPLFFAACALTLRRCRFSLFFLSLIIGSFLVMFGVPPLPALIRWVPIVRDVDQMRLLLVVGFNVAVLAGFGWDAFYQGRSSLRIRIVAGGFCAVAALAFLWFWHFLGPVVHALDSARWVFLKQQFLMLGAGTAVAVIATLWPSGWSNLIPATVCLTWTAVDLLCFGINYNPAIPRDRYYPPTPGLKWLQDDHTQFRVFAPGGVLVPNTPEIFGLSDARGCDYMIVRRYEELITGSAGDFYFYVNAKEYPPTLPLLNVKYIVTGKPVPLNPQFDLVYSKEISIYRSKSCLDRALLVYNYQVETNPVTVLTRVSAPRFAPRQTLLLEEEPTSPVGGHQIVDDLSKEYVRIISYAPDDIRIEVSLPRPGFLLLLDTYFPGWSATVNGEFAKIYRADYNFRAVALPAGKSTVSFSYRPDSLRIGVYLCAIGLAAICAAFCVPLLRKKKGNL